MNLSRVREELTKGLYDAVVAMDEEKVRTLSQSVLANGMDAGFFVKYGLMAAMEKAAELYSAEVYYVSELLLCADALQAGLRILGPHVAADGTERKKRMIIGTVEGDIHDVGKNIVKVMFEATGWDVHDLGKDVSPDGFIEEQAKVQADVIALSALMSTTMLAIPKAIRVIRGEHPAVPIIVGGAPLNREIARAYGADGYADNAGEAIAEAGALLLRFNR
jgi:methanogenic corrinoid protein MtbC1